VGAISLSVKVSENWNKLYSLTAGSLHKSWWHLVNALLFVVPLHTNVYIVTDVAPLASGE
jgi:hypothetical protein